MVKVSRLSINAVSNSKTKVVLDSKNKGAFSLGIIFIDGVLPYAEVSDDNCSLMNKQKQVCRIFMCCTHLEH